MFWRRKKEREFDEELQFHLDAEAEERAEAGLSSSEARLAAQRELGNVGLVKESTREVWGWMSLERIGQDVRYALRTMRKNPGFTTTAVLSLALGIGANTAIFSILNAVILRSLPVEDPQQLVQIKLGEGGDGEVTNPIWEQVRDHQQAFSGVLAYSPDRFDLADGGESHFAEGLWVSGDFFRVLGVPAMQGRIFTKNDDQRGQGQGALAVISYSFWKRSFAGDSSVIGKTIRLNRHTFEIVGVTPPWFRGLDVDRSYDVAIPLGTEPILRSDESALDNRLAWWLLMIGRISPGESLPQARDRLNASAPEIFRATMPSGVPPQVQKEYLKTSFALRPATTGFSDTGVRYRTALFALMAIAGIVLLIACANIANLLLARAAARQREFSVRMAIGASRSRIVRQLMTESLLLSISGAGAGLLFALWGSRLLVRLLSTSGNPIDVDLSPDARVLTFTIGMAIVTAVVFGFAPAFRGTGFALNQVLKESTRSALQGGTRFNLGKALVIGQVALSLVLLLGAGLFLGTLRNLLMVDAGFNRHNVLLVKADLQQAGVGKPQRIRTYEEILSRLRAVSGVESAATSVLTPITGAGWNGFTYPEGFTPQSERDSLIFFNRVSPAYFKTMRTPLLLGRDFSEGDDLRAPLVMILDESTARHFFGQANPIGKTIGMDKRDGGPGKDLYHVVGVVKDAKYNRIDEARKRTAYLVSGQDPDPAPMISYEVRSERPVEEMIPSVRSVISGVNRGISLEFRNFETQVNESLLQPRIVALLSSIFGMLALLLAMVGLYGITAYSVARRRGEIGIRMALGAQARSVVWLMLRDVAVILVAGMSVGFAVSLGAGRLVKSLLYGVQPNDPVQLAGAAILLALATAIAAYIPARRAARIDPMAALREE
jgi:putative ABC transport system permease protein